MSQKNLSLEEAWWAPTGFEMSCGVKERDRIMLIRKLIAAGGLFCALAIAQPAAAGLIQLTFAGPEFG